MKKVTISLYSFSELEETARAKATEEHYIFLTSEGLEIEDENGKITTDNYEPSEAEVVENIEANNYLFFSNGELSNCTSFCGKHPRAGETVLSFKGEEYTAF